MQILYGTVLAVVVVPFLCGIVLGALVRGMVLAVRNILLRTAKDQVEEGRKNVLSLLEGLNAETSLKVLLAAQRTVVMNELDRSGLQVYYAPQGSEATEVPEVQGRPN